MGLLSFLMTFYGCKKDSVTTNPTMKVSPTTLDLTRSKFTGTITVENIEDGEFTYTITSKPDWITYTNLVTKVTKTSPSTVTITADLSKAGYNVNGEPVKGTITFSQDGSSGIKEITVKLDNPVPNSPPTSKFRIGATDEGYVNSEFS
ncbi:MAG: Viral domain, partial [Bacteroidota bacterium]